MTGFVDPTRELMAVFRELPSDRPIAMINLLRFRETAAYPADHPDHAVTRTGAEAYTAYGRTSAAPFALKPAWPLPCAICLPRSSNLVTCAFDLCALTCCARLPSS